MAKTMRVRMAGKIVGDRCDNGVWSTWPEPGEEIELPEAEARSMLLSGMAVHLDGTSGQQTQRNDYSGVFVPGPDGVPVRSPYMSQEYS
ncbi:hypothetical protein [Cryptosporangium arvum]|uniref:Uncharacterized protein n=1 Tax=Cryptosporangium arvum DSM 44712 TaxID=927661 RepID=A0A010ZS30_9ACTN|nr:hypothetical protein [Cryptosporangium arvum]EXG80022.1 hypothetical protein CryarDRAFT_1081 [Cryptosporangium arvum DSM 44712]